MNQELTFRGVKITDVSHRNLRPEKGFQTSKPVSKTKPMELNLAQRNSVETYLRAVVRTPEGRKQYEKYSEGHNIDPLCVRIGEAANIADEQPEKIAQLVSGDPEVAELMNSVDPSSDFWSLMKMVDDDLHSKPKVLLITKIIELIDYNDRAKKFIGKLVEKISNMMDRFEIFGHDTYKRAHAFMIVCKGEDVFRNMQEDETFLSELDGQFPDIDTYVRRFPEGI